MISAPAKRGASAGPIAIVLLVVCAAVAGWFAGSWGRSSGTLMLTGHVTGRVSVASESGGKVCINPAEGGADRCAGLYRSPDDPTPRVGDAISVAIGQVRTSPSETIELFILEPTGTAGPS